MGFEWEDGTEIDGKSPCSWAKDVFLRGKQVDWQQTNWNGISMEKFLKITIWIRTWSEMLCLFNGISMGFNQPKWEFLVCIFMFCISVGMPSVDNVPSINGSWLTLNGRLRLELRNGELYIYWETHCTGPKNLLPVKYSEIHAGYRCYFGGLKYSNL